ncbi:MAG: hypothetical protein IKS51_09605 [Erysipelotrichaceae bacterium]|nr:hypothetical protein [Erysipelotrichaceae bacterium]
MESTELTVKLIVLFVPGIIGTFIYEICQNRTDMSNRDFIINVVLNAFASYSITYVIFKLLLGEGTSFLDALLDSSVKISMTEIMTASILSIALGFFESQLVRTTMKVNRKRNERNKRVRLSVWDDLFDENDGYDGHVKIVLNDQGIVYDGFVGKHSASILNKKEIYLKDVVKYDLKTGEELARIGGTYLQIRDDEDVIMEMIREDQNG